MVAWRPPARLRTIAPALWSWFCAIGVAAALGQPPASATLPSAYRPADGPFAVRQIDSYQLPRKHHEDPLPLLIRYPQARDAHTASQPLPLVIFSHGGGGDGGAFATLSHHWASYGYIVIHPTHADSIRLRRAHGEDLRAMRRNPRLLLRSVHLAQRCADIRLILDTLDLVEARINRDARAHTAPGHPPSIRIDHDRIAVAGHSAGAMTAQALAGVRLHVGRRTINLRDDRVRAVILISGQGTWRHTLRKDSWRDIHIPMLVITGSRDTAPVSGETPDTRQEPFTYAPPGDKFLLFIDGATHFSYAHKMFDPWHRQPPPKNPEYIASVVSFSTLAFLDAYLDERPAARDYLASRAITHYPGGKLRFDAK